MNSQQLHDAEPIVLYTKAEMSRRATELLNLFNNTPVVTELLKIESSHRSNDARGIIINCLENAIGEEDKETTVDVFDGDYTVRTNPVRDMNIEGSEQRTFTLYQSFEDFPSAGATRGTTIAGVSYEETGTESSILLHLFDDSSGGPVVTLRHNRETDEISYQYLNSHETNYQGIIVKESEERTWSGPAHPVEVH